MSTTPKSPHTRAHGEGGTSLILAMGFLALMGTFTASILTVAFTSFKTTQVVRGSQDKHYGADGGADVAVQLLRASSSYCPTVSGTPTNLPDQTINGRTVHITCQTLSGSTGTPGGGLATHSLVVTGYNNPNGTPADRDHSFRTEGNTLADSVSIGGPVFNAGAFEFNDDEPVVQIVGNLDQYNDSPGQYCSASKSNAASTGNPTVTGAWTCRVAASFPVPDPVPTLIVPTADAPAKIVQGECTIFFPGKYTATPTFDKNNKYYFASGVYYFPNLGNIHLAGELFGGKPGPTETQALTTATPCATDATANSLIPGSATGSGVEFVLGGSSKLEIDDHMKNKIELFARVPAIPASEGTPGVSIYAPRTSGPNYVAWNSDKVLHMDGNKSTMVVHGLLYTPNGNIDGIYALQNPGNAPVFMDGIVAQRITINFDNQSPVTSALTTINPGTPATPRTIVITATADPLDPGEAPTVIKAVVQLGTGAGTPATVLSWRKA
ncbi:MAG: hypothetical protein WEA75_00475 [Acidimicrobiia bacterium]